MSEIDKGIKIGEQIKSALIVFFVTLLATFCTNYLTFNDGEVTIGNAYKINEKYFIPIVIINFHEKIINDIKLQIPLSVKTKDIVTSRVMKIEKLKSDSKNDFNIINVSLVQGNVISRILVPVDSDEENENISLLNAKDLGLKVVNDSSAYSIWKRSAILAVVLSIVYVIFFMVWSYSYNSKRFKILNEIEKTKDIFYKEKKELTERSENLEEQLYEFKDKYDNESKEQKSELYNLKRNHYKIKFYLLRSVSQHKKEITFWRDVIKRIVLSGGSNKKSMDVVFREIAKSLGTYSTLGKLEVEYEHLKYLEETMSELKNGD